MVRIHGYSSDLEFINHEPAAGETAQLSLVRQTNTETAWFRQLTLPLGFAPETIEGATI